jgi:hypothetical protein
MLLFINNHVNCNMMIMITTTTTTIIIIIMTNLYKCIPRKTGVWAHIWSLNEVISSTEGWKLPLVSTDLMRSPPMEWVTQTIGRDPRPACSSFFNSSLLRYSRFLLQTWENEAQDNEQIHLTFCTLKFNILEEGTLNPSALILMSSATARVSS